MGMVGTILGRESGAGAARFHFPSQLYEAFGAQLGSQPDHPDRTRPTERPQLTNLQFERFDGNLAQGDGEGVERAAGDVSEEPQRQVKVAWRHPAEGRRGDPAAVEISGQELALALGQADRDKSADRLRLLAQKTFRSFQCDCAQAEGELGRNPK